MEFGPFIQHTINIGITYIIALAIHVDIRVLGCLDYPMTKIKIEWKRWHKEIETNPPTMTKP